MATVWDQTQIRFRYDDGNESVASWMAGVNSPCSVDATANVTMRVRVGVQQTGSTAAAFTGYLRYSKNGGTYTQVTDATTNVKAIDSPHIADGAATTNQIASTPFVAGNFDDVNGIGTATGSVAQNSYTEVEFCGQLVAADLADGDTLQFKVYSSAADACGSYTSGLPILTVARAGMAMTFSRLRRAIGRFAGYGRSPGGFDATQTLDVADILASGLRQFYSPSVLPGERYAHEWSFLRPVATLDLVAPVSEGTVTVVAGVVTLAHITAGTVHWPSWAADGELRIGSTAYTVSTRDSDHQLTLDNVTVAAAAGTAFELSKAVYDLPTNFAGLDGPLTYQPGSSILYVPIEEVSEHQVRTRLAETSYCSRPEIMAIRPKALDYTTGTRYEAIFSPRPDYAYALDYRYRVNPYTIDAGNLYPIGGEEHAETILEGCLAAAEKMLNDGQVYHQGLFMQRLMASVSHDRKLSCPPFLGRLRDGSDSPRDDFESLHNWDDNVVTYNDVAY